MDASLQAANLIAIELLDVLGAPVNYK